jgi:S-disulfanyl-L-cysteine oxidoreductase SoxD
MKKMKLQKTILISVLTAVGINPVFAESKGPVLGHAISPEEIVKWDISVFPDGEGLPEGEGNVQQGESVYKSKCMVCHGESGLGATADQLAGAKMELTSDYPEQTIGSYWPYATTVFDVVRRSMPMTAPGSLSNNETYAVTAYLLYLNNIIGKDDLMNADTLATVKMPNEDGFINIYEEEKSSKQ